jgi:hypothetical protein
MRRIEVDWDVLGEFLIYWRFKHSSIPPNHFNPRIPKLGLKGGSGRHWADFPAESVLAGVGRTSLLRIEMGSGAWGPPIGERAKHDKEGKLCAAGRWVGRFVGPMCGKSAQTGGVVTCFHLCFFSYFYLLIYSNYKFKPNAIIQLNLSINASP